MMTEHKPLTYEQMGDVYNMIASASERLRVPVAELKWHPGRVTLTLSVTRGGDTVDTSVKVEAVQYEHSSAAAQPPAMVEVELHTGEPRPEDVL